MNILISRFQELNTSQLFEIYKLRSEVFVVEQNCAYQDVDNDDINALHVMSFSGANLIAYCRLLPPGRDHATPRIGRVVVKKEYRGKALGKDLMRFAIGATIDSWHKKQISISAHLYLSKFYSDLGFMSVGEGYLEDNIPHIKMILNL